MSEVSRTINQQTHGECSVNTRIYRIWTVQILKLSPEESNIDSENVKLFMTNQSNAEEVVKTNGGRNSQWIFGLHKTKYEVSQPYSQKYVSDSKSKKY
jgi:hypothetical protein